MDLQKARFAELVTNYQNTVLWAQEAENALVAFLRSQQRVRALTASTAAGKTSVDLVLSQYKEGIADFNRVYTLERA